MKKRYIRIYEEYNNIYLKAKSLKTLFKLSAVQPSFNAPYNHSYMDTYCEHSLYGLNCTVFYTIVLVNKFMDE